MELVVCLHCARHVRARARECPFCGGAMHREMASRVRSRLSRGAILAAVAATSCHHSTPAATDPDTTDAADDVMHAKVTVYGGPPPFQTVKPPTNDGGTD